MSGLEKVTFSVVRPRFTPLEILILLYSFFRTWVPFGILNPVTKSPIWTFAIYAISLSGKYKLFFCCPTSVATVRISHSFKSVKVIPIETVCGGVGTSATVDATPTMVLPSTKRTSTWLEVLIFVFTSKSIP